MTLDLREATPTREAQVWFGRGGSEPYERALGLDGGLLRLVDADRPQRPVLTKIDVTRYAGEADEVDRLALAHTTGSVLDVGCGPARIVRAAILEHRLALGIDPSPAAGAAARARGLPVLRQSVFDHVPAAGQWSAVVLLDGNIGIGGDPVRLLARCSDLAAPTGTVLVETCEDTDRYDVFDAVLLDADDVPSLPFPWAEIGADALADLAADAGLWVRDSWTDGGRCFSLLAHA